MSTPTGDDSWLESALSEAGIDLIGLSGSVQLTGGASRTTRRISLELVGGATRSVIVQEGRAGFPGLGPETEAVLLTAADAAGAVVPEVICAGGDAFRTWLVTADVEGETIARRILREDDLADARRGLVAECARAIAAIHTVEIDELGLGEPVDQLDHWRRQLATFGHPHPAIEFALAHLEATRPEPTPVRLVHGDFRLGNFVVDESGLRSVLDWELAHLGDPVEDLGWLCSRPWRFGSTEPVGGLGERSELLAAYREAGGAEVDPAHLDWWELFACVRWAIICTLQTGAHLSGAHRSVELAAIGRRVCEAEYDILRHLAPDELDHCVEWSDSESTPTAPESTADLSWAPHDPPDVIDLVATVEELLRSDVIGQTSGRTSFMSRIAANVLATVGRELSLGPSQARRHGERLAAISVADDASLARRIADGTIDPDQSLEVIVGAVVARLVVANPTYARSPHTEQWH